MRGFFNALRLYNRIRPEAADTRQIDVGALARERDATGWGPVERIADLEQARGDRRKGTCREFVSSQGGELSLCVRMVVMSKGNDYRQQVEEAAARVEWCERKLSYERKRHRALKDLAATEDWLDGKLSPLPKTEGSASGELT